MPPLTATTVTETTTVVQEQQQQEVKEKKEPLEIVWRNVVIFTLLHAGLLVGFYYIFFKQKLLLAVYAYLYGIFGGLGITAGAHRLWSHRCYKAKLPMRLFLAICCSIANQNNIYEWCRDHRVHHKFSETDADPHNARRGFFFSHIGWLMVKKHPDVIKKGKEVDCSDLLKDPVIIFQRKYYIPLVLIFSVILPVAIPIYFWKEPFGTAVLICFIWRYCWSLNMTWLVNSAAHMWGNQPYDKYISPRENVWVSLGSIGEGWHNYHHTFPWDYKASELGWRINLTTMFIDFMAKIGQAYDLKRASPELVINRRIRTGDLMEDHDHHQ